MECTVLRGGAELVWVALNSGVEKHDQYGVSAQIVNNDADGDGIIDQRCLSQ